MTPDQKGAEPGPAHPPRRRGLLGAFRASFLTGLVVVLPIGLTAWLIWIIVTWIDGWILPMIPHYWRPDTVLTRYLGHEPPISVRGAGVVIFLMFTIIVGWIAKGLLGRSLLAWGEGLVDRMPYVRSVYSGLKQIAESVFQHGDAKFDRACLVEHPRRGTWSIAFVSGTAKGELAEKVPDDDEILTLFLATGFFPPSGFLVYVPKRDVIFLDMSVEDAAKLILSAGLVYPSETRQPESPPRAE